MIVVTGANGALFGRPVLDRLRLLAPDAHVVAGTRDPAAADGLRRTDVEVRRVDFTDPTSLVTGFAGATTVLVNGTNYGTPKQRRGAQHAAAIRAAAVAGVGRIVYTSWPDPDHYRLSMMSDFTDSEELIHQLGIDAVILRTTYGIAQTVGRDVTGALTAAVLAAPAADARTAPAHIHDLAEATARVLVDDGYRAGTYTLTATESIGWTDLAQLASRISGSSIVYRPIDDDEFVATASSQGLPSEAVDILLGVYRSFRDGWTGTPTDHLAAILGRPPRTAIEAVAAVVDV